ncbi:unnamed protein product [Rotaria socialis]|uniref:Peptidoglycan-recognition protein n=2 Tax=Rotaria socialis TaxID=392032 RepID=A0A818DS47_9BILA|nr:unnamed protein product [Rotaria socialis]CAF3423820.1 unnamed protein product [Rotaria socialis]CAF3428812.1 unnamed protein product [Rotaria socialis]CAF3447060.1 unnamed protein product [Rotaria socialis]CAF4225310.1 unnamed protein product [Rotaria socialis]
MDMMWLIYSLLLTVVNAQSRCDEVSFVDRDGWGAQEPSEIQNLTKKPLSFYIIHHEPGFANCYDDKSCIDQVKNIQYGQQNLPTIADIFYHFLVGENGKVYEGRGWGREGAHSKGWNKDAFGICIIGNFTTASPNAKALKAVRSWIDCGKERSHVKENYYIITHRQSQSPGWTNCPGNGTLDVVRKWPRYCSFENSGEFSAVNDMVISRALNFCKKEFSASSTASTYLIKPMISFCLLLIYYL